MNWVEEFLNSDKDLYVGNFRGLNDLIMVCPMSGDTDWWLASSEQKFELSESGKRLFIVDYSNKDFPRIAKTFNMSSIASFGYTTSGE